MNDESPQRRTPPTYLMLALLCALVLGVTVLVRLVSEDRRYQVVPQSVAGHLAVIGFAMLAATVLAAVGRRWLNRLSAALMGVVGSAFVVTLAPSLPAFVLGCLAGAVIAFDWESSLRRGVFQVLVGLAWMLPFVALGVAGGGVARSLAISSGRSNWIGPVFATVAFATGQLAILGLLLANRLRRSRAAHGSPRVLLTCAMLMPLVLLIPVYWQLGWCGEMVRRVWKMESEGCGLALDWKKASWGRLLWRGPMVMLQYQTAPPQAWHWATVQDLAPIGDLTLRGRQITDNVAMNGWSCSAFAVSLDDTSATGQMFRDRSRFLRMTSLSAMNSPISDEGLNHICQFNTLSWMALIETDVTEQGLTSLSRLDSLTTLILRDDIGPVGFSHLAKVKSLRKLVILSPEPLSPESLSPESLSPESLSPATKVSGLEQLSAMPQLGELQLNCPVDAAELQHLLSCPSLYSLVLRIESLSPEMIAVLQKLQAKKVKLTITTSSRTVALKLGQLVPPSQVVEVPQ